VVGIRVYREVEVEVDFAIEPTGPKPGTVQ
jgi:hypothetical protein